MSKNSILMILEREAIEVENYFKKHPEKLTAKGKHEEDLNQIEKELEGLRQKGFTIKTIKK